MKKLILTSILIVGSLITTQASGLLGSQPTQTTNISLVKKTKSDNPQNVIKIKLFPFLWRVTSLQYERTLKDNLSIACDVNFMFYSASISSSSLQSAKASYTGFGVSPELRFYPGANAPRGFFIAPYATYFTMGLKVEGKDANGSTGSASISGINAIGGGALLGWKWLIADVFAIEAHLGVNYLSFSTPDRIDITYADGTKSTEPAPSLSAEGVIPTGGISLGYGF